MAAEEVCHECDLLFQPPDLNLSLPNVLELLSVRAADATTKGGGDDVLAVDDCQRSVACLAGGLVRLE